MIYPETRKSQKVEIRTIRPRQTKKGYKEYTTFKTVKKSVLVEGERSTTIGECGEFRDEYVTLYSEEGTVELDGKTYSVSRNIKRVREKGDGTKTTTELDGNWGTITLRTAYKSPFGGGY